ncbi:MAG: VOC family protein [Chloroflexi bacterium]|nr:VOC family protein [Chloroflexota bacterium]MCI0578414.1 VOC family protein [Chloroflexota bacterium]MCI0648154.1 VOC family protein [Chloroflexota bacterium]MCI0726669.1 VOC family protein [Chloroflexota bacterium]
MHKIQAQGIHHITLVGATRQSAIDFWEGVLGMPFIFEQPNLDNADESHLYFDPGDGRLITVFTNETREIDTTPNPEGIGNLHHIAFNVSRATFTQVARRLDERGIKHTDEIDRGFMHSIYFRDPLGQRYEMACYKFEPPVGVTHAQVLFEAHHLRVAEGAYNITDSHLAEAIERLTRRTQGSLSEDRSPRHAYPRPVAGP